MSLSGNECPAPLVLTEAREQAIADATAAFKSGDYARCVELSRLLIGRGMPQDVEALRLMMRAAYRLGCLDQSRGAAIRLLQHGPLKKEAEIMLARIASLVADQDDAARRWRFIAEANPTSAEARAKMGVSLFKLGRFSEAVEASRAALQLAPGNRMIVRTLVRSLIGAGDAEGAASALITLLSTSPTDAASETRVLVRDGEILAAARVLATCTKAITECDPELPPRIIKLLCQRGRSKQLCSGERIAAMRAALNLAPGDDVLRIELLRQLLASGETRELTAHGARIAKNLETVKFANELLRDLTIHAKNALAKRALTEAHDSARTAIAIDPGNQTAQNLYERIKAARRSEARTTLVQRNREAIEQTTRLVEDYPDDSSARRLHARALIATRRYAEAKVLLEEVTISEDAAADDFVQLARASRASHDTEGAINACFNALALHHEDAAALMLLAHLFPARQ